MKVNISVGACKIVILAPLFPPAKNGGGPIRTLKALVAATPTKFEIRVLTGDRDLGDAKRLPVDFDCWKNRDGVDTYNASSSSLRGLVRAFREVRRRRPDVVYLNGFFDLRFSILPQLLWRAGYWRGTVRLLAPRGEFGTGALKRRSGKKRAYMMLYRALGLHRSVVWHASTEQEAAAIRTQWGHEATVLVRENETLLPARSEPAADLDVEPSSEPAFRAIFLGRIVEHKGLHLALLALARVNAPVTFDVFGPAQDGSYVKQCRELARSLPENIVVVFHGSLEPEQTREILAAYDLLIMPTAGENFGHVIAESLSVSCPVLCSTHTPWTDVLKNGGGAALPLQLDAWAAALNDRSRRSAKIRLADRRRAGAAYDEWRSRPAAPHVFEMLEREVLSATRV